MTETVGTTATDEIAELEARIAVLKKQRDQEFRARLDSVKAVYEFVLAPKTEPWMKLMDPAVITLRLEGVITNKSEMIAAGHSERMLFQGGMTYLFNTATGRFICSTGGGSTYNTTEEGFEALAAWYLEHPEGGNVTAIVEAHRDTKPRWP